MTTSSTELAAFRSQVPITGSRAYLFNGALAPAATRGALGVGCVVRGMVDGPECGLYTGWACRVVRATPTGIRPADLRRPGLHRRHRQHFPRGQHWDSRAATTQDRRNVVVDEGTYPSSLYPWYASGDWEVRMVATDGVADAADALADHIDADTVAVCISHVAPYTGRRHDLAAISAAAHAHGAALLVDAAAVRRCCAD